jgi:uncharacterized protein
MSEPLLELFYALRRRNFVLGVSEYLLALEALAHGFGTGSREELVSMCQTIWAKSPEEQIAVDQAFSVVLPKRLTQRDLDAIAANAESARLQEDTGVSTENKQSRPGSAASHGSKTESTRVGVVTVGVGGVSMSALDLDRRELNPNLDFVGELPVTRRQMKRAWSYYRRMRRVGAPVEVDPGATIEQTYRLGVFFGPVMISRRKNMARMLILKDERGSMTPFRRVTVPLLESAQQGGLAAVSVAYFHDVPGEVLFRDPALNKPVKLQEIIEPFVAAGVLIISDGGAARGVYDKRRVEQTVQFLHKLLDRWTPNVAWLNPTPPERWPGTSADAIRQAGGVQMFTLSRRGLDSAVDVLRGRR